MERMLYKNPVKSITYASISIIISFLKYSSKYMIFNNFYGITIDELVAK